MWIMCCFVHFICACFVQNQIIFYSFRLLLFVLFYVILFILDFVEICHIIFIFVFLTQIDLVGLLFFYKYFDFCRLIPEGFRDGWTGCWFIKEIAFRLLLFIIFFRNCRGNYILLFLFAKLYWNRGKLYEALC